MIHKIVEIPLVVYVGKGIPMECVFCKKESKEGIVSAWKHFMCMECFELAAKIKGYFKEEVDGNTIQNLIKTVYALEKRVYALEQKIK